MWPAGFWPSNFWPDGFWPDPTPLGPSESPAVDGFWPAGCWPDGFWPDGFWPSGDGAATLRAAVRWMLRADPAVFAMVGERIRYAGSLQRDASPRITYTVPSDVGWADLDGPTGMDDARVRVSVWADGSVRAAVLARAVRLALDGFRGPVGLVWVESCAWLQDVDLPEPARGGRDASIYQIACDFSFIHRLP